MGFQKTINNQPAPGIAGDFASTNPRASMLAGPGALIAGAAGVTVGRFAWVDQSTGEAANNGIGVPDGFVSREMQAQITQWLAESGNVIQAGAPLTLFKSGDFWAEADTQAIPGQKVFAKYADGSISTGDAGSPPQGASVTGSIAAATQASVTASIAPSNTPDGRYGVTTMTVTAVGAGTLVEGAPIAGSGVVAGSKIVKQLTGTAGGVGTYEINIPQTVASTTITSDYGILTVTAVGSGALGIGDVLSGSSVSAGNHIISLGTGNGATGTYNVATGDSAASTTITATSAVETPWYVESFAAAGEVFKISTRS
ncbi:MAG TPA: hypothetical protein VKA32_07110 [Gammaproteobacteria bacterium]|nr:hypothetical protein [Gammaproteobacteria bacterium]